MQSGEMNGGRIAPNGLAASAVAAFFVDEIELDGQRLALPRPEIQIVVRFGPSARNNLDMHALGMQSTVRRKFIRRGQRAVTARLHLGASRAVLGVPASAVAGSVIALEELWGHAAVDRLVDRLSGVSGTLAAVEIIEAAVAERLLFAEGRDAGARLSFAEGRDAGARLSFAEGRDAGARLSLAEGRDADARLALAAAARLASANVSSVADELGVSERHLRRVFRAVVGASPKEFARLARFRRAVAIARKEGGVSWATVAAAAGYYDQAHLIDEFRTIGGVTPRALLSELGTSRVARRSRV